MRAASDAGHLNVGAGDDVDGGDSAAKKTRPDARHRRRRCHTASTSSHPRRLVCAKPAALRSICTRRDAPCERTVIKYRTSRALHALLVVWMMAVASATAASGCCGAASGPRGPIALCSCVRPPPLVCDPPGPPNRCLARHLFGAPAQNIKCAPQARQRRAAARRAAARSRYRP